MGIELDDDKHPREQILMHLHAAIDGVERGDLDSAVSSIVAARWGAEILLQFKAARRGKA